jgi:hypothetical protein
MRAPKPEGKLGRVREGGSLAAEKRLRKVGTFVVECFLGKRRPCGEGLPHSKEHAAPPAAGKGIRGSKADGKFLVGQGRGELGCKEEIK